MALFTLPLLTPLPPRLWVFALVQDCLSWGFLLARPLEVSDTDTRLRGCRDTRLFTTPVFPTVLLPWLDQPFTVGLAQSSSSLTHTGVSLRSRAKPPLLCWVAQFAPSLSAKGFREIKGICPPRRVQLQLSVDIFPGGELTGYEVLSSLRISRFVNDFNATLQTDSRGIYVGLAADRLPFLTRWKSPAHVNPP